jgi:hypothetical protein
VCLDLSVKSVGCGGGAVRFARTAGSRRVEAADAVRERALEIGSGVILRLLLRVASFFAA